MLLLTLFTRLPTAASPPCHVGLMQGTGTCILAGKWQHASQREFCQEALFLWRAVVFRTPHLFFLPHSGNTRLILLSNLGSNHRDGKKTKNFLPHLRRNNCYIKCFSQEFEVYTNCFIQSENDMYNPVLNLSPNLHQR